MRGESGGGLQLFVDESCFFACLTVERRNDAKDLRAEDQKWLKRSESREFNRKIRSFRPRTIANKGVSGVDSRTSPTSIDGDFTIRPSKREFSKDNEFGEIMVKLVVRDRETIQEAVRRFRKLVERSGIKKEMRRREYYEKPSETNRRARLRAERRARRTRMLSR